MLKNDQNPKKVRGKNVTRCIIKKVLAAWEDSTNKSEKDKEYGDAFMINYGEKKIFSCSCCSLMAIIKDKKENMVEKKDVT